MVLFIYVLKLEQNKYYIGKTHDVEKRVDQHLNGNGAEFTKIYKPINLIKSYEGKDEDERNETLKYMNKYGINNVRGGAWCKEKISEEEISFIEKMFEGENNSCYNCGIKGHFAKNCNKNNNKIKRHFTEQKGAPDFVGYKTGNFPSKSKNSLNLKCFKCDKMGHLSTNCPKNKIKCFNCGVIGHLSTQCYKRKV